MRSMHLTEGHELKSARKVMVKLLGTLIPIVGSDQIVLTVEGSATILDLLKKLPKGLRERIFSEDGLASDIIVLLNGVSTSCLEPLDKITVDELEVKEVVLIPVIHGG